MDEFNSIEEILDFAIAGEAEASEFYTELAGKMETPAMREVFESFAKEEMGHKTKLEGVKACNIQPKMGEAADLKIADYMVDIEPSPDMDYMFLSLAQEEAKHKLRFEIEYDDEIMKEN